jgi:hypothetical protein
LSTTQPLLPNTSPPDILPLLPSLLAHILLVSNITPILQGTIVGVERNLDLRDAKSTDVDSEEHNIAAERVGFLLLRHLSLQALN